MAKPVDPIRDRIERMLLVVERLDRALRLALDMPPENSQEAKAAEPPTRRRKPAKAKTRAATKAKTRKPARERRRRSSRSLRAMRAGS